MWNTWVGALVGAIPPVIGCVAASGSIGIDALLLGGLLYCWQFPHFNSLSWRLTGDYARAGYQMASVLNPQLALNAALCHSLALFPLSYGLVWTGLCSNALLIDSTMLNGAMLYLSFLFQRSPGKGVARQLFFFSLIHLPLLLISVLIHRNNKMGKHEVEANPSRLTSDDVTPSSYHTQKVI